MICRQMAATAAILGKLSPGCLGAWSNHVELRIISFFYDLILFLVERSGFTLLLKFWKGKVYSSDAGLNHGGKEGRGSLPAQGQSTHMVIICVTRRIENPTLPFSSEKYSCNYLNVRISSFFAGLLQLMMHYSWIEGLGIIVNFGFPF